MTDVVSATQLMAAREAEAQFCATRRSDLHLRRRVTSPH